MHLQGTPSDQLPEVLETGETDARYLFISFSGREPSRRDAEYIAWHSLDHRPEQYRLADLRHSMRLVSTPLCRELRAASVGRYDHVDHVMNYMFATSAGIPGFNLLGGALNVAGRMPLRLPSHGHFTADLAGKYAAQRAVAGADVLPWRPALGVYLIVEVGHVSPATLTEVPGVAGVWWYHGNQAPEPYETDGRGMQITYCFLDSEPTDVARDMQDVMRERWRTGSSRGLLAAAFYSVVPFEWGKYLPD